MNVRLKKNFTFSTGIVFNDEYMINDYTLTADIITVSDDQEYHNISYERMKYWIARVLHGSVLINQDNELISAYRATGQRVLTFPGDPVDQLVGIMLYLKLNSVCENHMVISDIKLSSDLGDRMIYLHSAGENIGPMADEGWWLDPRPVWTLNKSSSGKIVALDRAPEWKDFDLDWNEHSKEMQDTVVFADFKKHDTE